MHWMYISKVGDLLHVIMEHSSPISLVIGERIITPGAIVQLIFKLQLSSPLESSSNDEDSAPSFLSRKPEETDVDFEKRRAKAADERESYFLGSKKEAEEGIVNDQLAHAPYWPEVEHPLSCFSQVELILKGHTGSQAWLVGYDW